MLSIEFAFHPAFFFITITSYYHTYTTYSENDRDIIKGDRDDNKGILHYKFWFRSFG